MKRNKYNKLATHSNVLEPIIEDLGYQEMEMVKEVHHQESITSRNHVRDDKFTNQ